MEEPLSQFLFFYYDTNHQEKESAFINWQIWKEEDIYDTHSIW